MNYTCSSSFADDGNLYDIDYPDPSDEQYSQNRRTMQSHDVTRTVGWKGNEEEEEQRNASKELLESLTVATESGVEKQTLRSNKKDAERPMRAHSGTSFIRSERQDFGVRKMRLCRRRHKNCP